MASVHRRGIARGAVVTAEGATTMVTTGAVPTITAAEKNAEARPPVNAYGLAALGRYPVRCPRRRTGSGDASGPTGKREWTGGRGQAAGGDQPGRVTGMTFEAKPAR